jgi:hypothetical protein
MEQRKKKGIPEKTYLSARVRFPLSFSSVSPTALDTIAFFLSLDLSLCGAISRIPFPFLLSPAALDQ